MRYEVYKDSALGILWYCRPSDQSFQEMGESNAKLLSDPNVRILKCVDTDLDNKMIAAAHWSIYETERTLEEVEEDLLPRRTWPEDNRAARLDFLGGIFQSTKEIMGTKPHVILESLITHQDHHRRGAGSLLLSWGVGEADRLGLVAYLAASEAGKPLYERFAFEPVGEVIFDGTKYGGKSKDLHVVRKVLIPHCQVGCANSFKEHDPTTSLRRTEVIVLTDSNTGKRW
jgi:GNAT superfamily N-acetyltransferase